MSAEKASSFFTKSASRDTICIFSRGCVVPVLFGTPPLCEVSMYSGFSSALWICPQ